MKGYYHVSSHGLKKNSIFIDEEDFIAGINDIAICSLKFYLKILCFCLMDNHFHFILSGDFETCCSFAEEYKRRCGMRMRLKRMEVNGLRRLRISINEISDTEYLENAIAYVLRNPLAAKMIVMPYHYGWSSADIYFRGERKQEGTCLNDLPERKRMRILKSKVAVPDSYLVDEKGMILHECFVDYRLVEEIFRHPSRLLFLLTKKLESDMEIKFGIADMVTYTDAELKSMVNELIFDEFGCERISGLSNEQKIRLCTLIRKRFRASSRQISRIIRIDQEVVDRVI